MFVICQHTRTRTLKFLKTDFKGVENFMQIKNAELLEIELDTPSMKCILLFLMTNMLGNKVNII